MINFSISPSELLSVLANLMHGTPFLSTMNLVKFHLIRSKRNPGHFFFKNSKSGCVFGPFTSIFSKTSNFPPIALIVEQTSWLLPGSCFPNFWLNTLKRGLPDCRETKEPEALDRSSDRRAPYKGHSCCLSGHTDLPR